MKYFIKVLLFFLFSFFNFNIYSQNWQLIWSDEFNDTLINPFIWTHESGGSGWGNNELQYYTNRPQNSYIEDGKLIIKALRENYSGKLYTSARLKTQNRKFWKYGKIEARMKLPFGQGIWPAFWMLGQNISSVGWPACGEIDIMEMIGGQGRENTVHGTLHWDNNGVHAQAGDSYSIGGSFADDFHNFRIEWSQTLIIWYVDDVLFNVINITPTELSEFHQDFFIILNLAVGGNWPGNPDTSTVFPQYYEIDYVRVYQDLPNDVNDDELNPSEFNLEQNYPNPFNPTTRINFSIPEESFVTLKVYSSVGSEISTIVNKNFSAGKHEVFFNAENISSQVLFYQVTAQSKNNNFISTKKMIVIK